MQTGDWDRAVFHVVDSLAIGGAERMVVDIANGLAARGWRVHLVATRSSGPLADELDDRVSLHRLNRRSRFDLGGVRRFRALIRRHRPAVVHAHGWSTLQFTTVALVAVRRAPALVFHDHRSRGLAPLGWTYRASVWPSVRAYLAVDESQLSRLPRARRHPLRMLVPNGSVLDRFDRKQTYTVGTTRRLVMVANLRLEKAHPVLFEALALLASRGLRVHTDLLGATDDDAYLSTCLERLEELGLRESVRIAGASDTIGSALAGYDLGVLTSTSESGPVALIEYLAAGLPFVVTDVGNVPQSLPTPLRRWVVRPNDPVALADLVEEALSRPEEDRRGDAELGIRFAHDSYSINRTLNDVETAYHRLLSR